MAAGAAVRYIDGGMGIDRDVPELWRAPLSSWAQWMTAADRPATTVYLRTYHLRRFAQVHPDPWAVTVDVLAGWLASHGWATETRRSNRASLVGFYGWAHATGRMGSNPAALLPPVRPPAGKPRPAPETAVREALDRAEPRVRLMVRLGAHYGLRRGEIAAVHSDDVEADLLGWSLRVTGKGRKVRRVPLQPGIAAELRAADGWVFPNGRGGHLSPAHVGKLVSAVLPAGVSTHSLRHRMATVSYASTRDLLAVGEVLGHARPETTRRYVLLPEDAARAVILAAAS